jgi:hypothetical protein
LEQRAQEELLVELAEQAELLLLEPFLLLWEGQEEVLPVLLLTPSVREVLEVV